MSCNPNAGKWSAGNVVISAITVVRARCRALLTAATLVPSAEAVSLAGQPTPVPFGQGGERGMIHPQPLLRSTSWSSQMLPSGSAKSVNDW